MPRFMGSDSTAGNPNVKMQRACAAHVCKHVHLYLHMHVLYD